MRDAGIDVEDAPRRFVPHVTVARDARAWPADAPIAPVAWHVDRVRLVDSRGGEGPPQDDALGEWPLRAD